MGIKDMYNWALVKVGLKQPEPKLTREQSMNAIPIRNPLLHWARNDEGTIVVAMERRTDWMGQAMSWLFMVPPKRKVELDDVGSTVWEACDGENTVNDIVTILAREYKLSRREVEMSLTKYLQTLGQRKMIGFMVDRETAEEAGVAQEQDVVGLEDVAKTKEELEKARREAELEAEEGRRLLEETEKKRAEREGSTEDEEDADQQLPENKPLIKIEDPHRGLGEQ